ncbi:MAG: HupE/UreJ family protein, partial [Phycisphaeraceae bacterium]|nr:HupE/UreJ family protein [Phycisphaeraceae bacterium]
GHATVSVRFDVLSFLLNEEPAKASDDAIWALVRGPSADVENLLESGGPRLQRHTSIWAEGQEVQTKLLKFPTVAEFERWKHDLRTPGADPRLPWIAEAEIECELKSGDVLAPTASIQFPEVLGELVLVVEPPKVEAWGISLKAGRRSDEILLYPLKIDVVQNRPNDFVSFVRMGIEHIVPEGLDHMLFILGLFLASPRMKSLLVMVTMFTLAHSVTLALAATGIVVAPPRVIEPLIALSIAAVAIENIFSSRASIQTQAHSPTLAPIGEVASEECRTLPPTPSLREGASELRVRAAIVFAFGLVHGLGFASAFKEMELPRSVLVPALVGFNVGVEVGQLLVLSFAFVLIGWAGKKNWYRGVIVVPGSVVIACVGLYWAVTRVMSG